MDNCRRPNKTFYQWLKKTSCKYSNMQTNTITKQLEVVQNQVETSKIKTGELSKLLKNEKPDNRWYLKFTWSYTACAWSNMLCRSAKYFHPSIGPSIHPSIHEWQWQQEVGVCTVTGVLLVRTPTPFTLAVMSLAKTHYIWSPISLLVVVQPHLSQSQQASCPNSSADPIDINMELIKGKFLGALNKCQGLNWTKCGLKV